MFRTRRGSVATWEPVVKTLLAATALLYVVGLVRLWTTAGRSKGIRAWQVLAFAGGWTALVIAQHDVLMVLAAPLLVLGRPLIALLWLMPSRWRFPIAQAAQRLALLLFVLLVACKSPEKQQPIGDAAHGRQLIDKYGCAACHVIPQVEGAKGMVGPTLEHVASRQKIGGKLTNTPQNMVAWLQNPQVADPANSMPNLGVTPADARDITAYLGTLK